MQFKPAAIALVVALPICAATATDPSEIDEGYDAEAAAAIARIEARQAKLAEQDSSYGDEVRRLPAGSVTGSRLRPTEGLARQVRNADADILEPGSAVGAQRKVAEPEEVSQ